MLREESAQLGILVSQIFPGRRSEVVDKGTIGDNSFTSCLPVGRLELLAEDRHRAPDEGLAQLPLFQQVSRVDAGGSKVD